MGQLKRCVAFELPDKCIEAWMTGCAGIACNGAEEYEQK
jgi:hypothetical protein